MTVTLGPSGPAQFIFTFCTFTPPLALIFMEVIPVANPEQGLGTLYELSVPGAEGDGSKVLAIQAGGSR